MISDALEAFLVGYERVFGCARAGVMRAAVKAVG
jgi:hypothetical protein